MATSALPVETPRAILDDQFFSQAVRDLCERDGDLAAVVEKFGPPPFWKREPGFPTLIYIILEQQVSLASARALYSRLQDAVRPFTPNRCLKLTETHMRRLGFTRQKTHYTRRLADAIHRRQLQHQAPHT